MSKTIDEKSEDALEQAPVDAAAARQAVAKGDQLRDDRDWHRAMTAYHAALTADPGMADIWVQFGHACKECGQPDQAELAYRRALDLLPEVADTHLQLGHVLKLMGRRLEAINAYQQALDLDPELEPARREIMEVQSDTQLAPSTRTPMTDWAGERSRQRDPRKPAAYNIVFDVSDLIQYFQNARLPTGIQRVQIEVITNLFTKLDQKYLLQLACFSRLSDTWVELPEPFFRVLCKLALVSGDPEAADWQRVREELRTQLEHGSPLEFPRGAFLINLGTSWWLQNYFLHVRAAKAKYGIRYVPFVHDCIPIMTPEHCTAGLTRDFISWTLGAFQHADHILVNSKATGADVQRVAAYLGHSIAAPEVITLDADFRLAIKSQGKRPPAVSGAQLFLKNHLQPGNYVLFVATIESRKNHVLAFSAWLALLKKYGPSKVPMLVCVGNRGWLNDAVYAKLEASAMLRKKVVMLSRIPDQHLELLYKNCAFTLYPSEYEGWGLPVTESLCYGKVPLVSNCSSLPEAGGEFAEYFQTRSEGALFDALERLIYDTSYRSERERKIADGFRPRSWGDIGMQIAGLIRKWNSQPLPPLADQEQITARSIWPFTAKLGRYYPITENGEAYIWPGMTAGEMFRQGEGWWWPEPWGCWTKSGVASLAFMAEIPQGEAAAVFVKVRGVQGRPGKTQVGLVDCSTMEFPLGADENRWLAFRLNSRQVDKLRQSSGRPLFEFLFESSEQVDFRTFTGNLDTRVAAMGVCGFMLCLESDIQTRQTFIESITIGDLSTMSGKPADGYDQPLTV